MLACGKHFPGHGDTSLDSHLALPRLSHDRDRLEQIELRPFRAAQGKLSAIMTAHVVFDTIAPHTPATLAPAVVQGLLRDELGYQGVVLSDDLEMKAIADHYGIEQAACMAIEAGCDSLLVCSDLSLLERARRALAERARHDRNFAQRLSEAAERSIAMRQKCRPEPVLDPSTLQRALCEDEARELSLEIAEHVTRLAR